MRKLNVILLSLLILFPITVQAAAPSRTFNYVAHTTIDPAQNNTNENTLYSYLQAGVDTYAAGTITNDAISAIAAISYSKLNILGSIVNADVSTSAAITYSKLNLSNSIVDADINSSAAISDSKLAQISTAGKVSGSALTSLSSIPSGAGIIPSANISVTYGSVAGNYASGSYLIGGPSKLLTDSTHTSYSKQVEMYLPRGGTLTITFGMSAPDSGYTIFGQIYRNGVAVGTERSFVGVPTGWTEFTENISGWSAGDLLQIYAYTNSSGKRVVSGGVRIFENAPLTETFGVGGAGKNTGQFTWYGSDTPTNLNVAALGSIGDFFVNAGGGATTTLYVKTGASTWTAK